MNLRKKFLDNENSEKNDSDNPDDDKEGVDEEEFLALDNAIDNSEEKLLSDMTFGSGEETYSNIESSDRDYLD